MKKTRERIVRKAFQVFSKKGYDGTRMEDISRAARINKATIYYYFEGKRELYKEVLYVQAKRIIPQIMEAISGPEEVENKLSRIVEVYLSFLESNPDVFKLYMREVCSGGRHLRDVLRRLMKEYPFLRQGGLAGKYEELGLTGKFSFDPVHFWLHIIGMSFAHFMMKPFIEVVYQMEVDEKFIAERKRSIVEFVEKAVS